jgi:hypothetical protein
MSSQTIRNNTGQQITVDTDRSKIFLWKNRYESGNYTNAGGSAVVLAAGTLLGRISATGLLIPLASAASDGSQYPVGILADDYTVAAGATVALAYCVEGDVATEKVVLAGSDTMNTPISGRRIFDRIGADTVGIKLVSSTEMTDYDN